MADQRIERRLAAILAADGVGYSRLTRADEAGTRAQFNAHLRELIEPRIADRQGRLVSTSGDALLGEFASVDDAVRCALDVQHGMSRRNDDVPDDRRMAFRIGINLGDVIVEGDDIHGDGVNIASRMESLAEPGGICVSGKVFDEIVGKIDLVVEDLGPQQVKNIDDPTRAVRVGPASSFVSRETVRTPAVAVLPFENLSGDPEQEYFADGLTEDIITVLSLWRSFPVIARNSVFAFKGTSPDIRRVGEELGASYVIEGSVRRSGDRVRVTAQLIDAENGHHVWAERYDRALDDFFELQDEIADRIAAIIEPALAKAEGKRIAAKRPTDLAAWEYCLKGFAHLHKYIREDTILAREMFVAALALDPDYARAYAGIAYAHIQDYRFGFGDSLDETRRAMFDAARRAIALDETDSRAHTMLARAYTLVGDEESSIAEGRRALKLNPHDTDAQLSLGTILTYWGQPKEGIGLLESGLELNPLEPRNFNFMAHLSLAYLCLGEYDKAANWGRESTRRNPDFFESHVNLASDLGYLDRGDEALELLSRFDGSASDYVTGRAWVHQAVTDRLLEGLRKAGVVA